jgi:hypothetical protein
MHIAMKEYVENANRPLRAVLKVYEPLDLAVKTAISNLQSEHQMQQSSCFPTLSVGEKEQKYKQNDYLPADAAHRICILCNHPYVDEPNINKSLQEKYEKKLRIHEEWKEEAKKEAAKKNLNLRWIPVPKLIQPYHQCHCHQMFCLGIKSQLGSSCPVECKGTN